jgi:hypothetical protein
MGLIDWFYGREKKKKIDASDFIVQVIVAITVLVTCLWFTGQLDRIINAGYYEALDNGYRAMEWCKVERNFTSCCASTCAECIDMFQEEFHTNWTFECPKN